VDIVLENKISAKNKIVVIGKNHHNALGIIRSLGEYGFELYFICLDMEKSFVRKSKYIKESWCIEDDFELFALLKSKFIYKNNTILMPADDFATSILDSNLEELSKNFILPNINSQNNEINRIMNKTVMNEIAKRHSFNVPKDFHFDLEDEKAFNDILKNLKFPYIIKPLKSIEGEKTNILIVQNSEEFKASIQTLRKKKISKVLVQEFIEKTGEVGIQGVVTYNRKEVIISGIINKVRTSKSAPGSTSYGEILDTHSKVNLEVLKNLLHDVGYVGIFDIEMVYNEVETYFIEINFRNGAYGYAFTKAGVNLPAIWCLEAMGIEISSLQKFIKKRISFMNELSDIKNIGNKLSALKWFSQFLKSDTYLTLNTSDIKPFIFRIIY